MSGSVRAVLRYEHSRVADGKDVDFVFALDEIAGE